MILYLGVKTYTTEGIITGDNYGNSREKEA